MPKRMLDDSYLSSPSLAKCSPRAQDAFPRFILLADDFGCFEALPKILLARGWPYRSDVTEAEVWSWLEEYVAAGMACLWTEKERRWCYLTGWDGPHGQRKRAEYDPEAPRGTPGAHGSKRRTPRPPAELVAAVLSGARRDVDGLPPGVDRPTFTPVPPREVGGSAAGNTTFPGGNAAGGKLSDSGPAREFAGNAREMRGSAAPVPVPVPVPDPAAAAAARAAAARDEPPRHLPLVLDLTEMGPLGAELRARLEQGMGTGLAVAARGREREIADECEQLVAAWGGVGPAFDFVRQTIAQREHYPASMAWVAKVLRESLPARTSP